MDCTICKCFTDMSPLNPYAFLYMSLVIVFMAICTAFMSEVISSGFTLYNMVPPGSSAERVLVVITYPVVSAPGVPYETMQPHGMPIVPHLLPYEPHSVSAGCRTRFSASSSFNRAAPSPLRRGDGTAVEEGRRLIGATAASKQEPPTVFPPHWGRRRRTRYPSTRAAREGGATRRWVDAILRFRTAVLVANRVSTTTMAQQAQQVQLLDKDDPVTEIRAATSVWEPPNHPPRTTDGWRVASLEAAGNPGVAVQPAQLPAIDARPEARSVCIALVKHQNTYTPVVDGLVPQNVQAQAQAQPTVQRCKLTHHRGYHEAPNAKTAVFSPCAVVVLLEDGQSAPLKCSVQMWQQMEQRVVGPQGPVAMPLGDEVMMDDREVRPCRASDVTFDVVYTPYPVRFARPPRVGIYDMSQVHRWQMKQGINSFIKTLEPYAGLLFTLAGQTINPGGGWRGLPSSLWRRVIEWMNANPPPASGSAPASVPAASPGPSSTPPSVPPSVPAAPSAAAAVRRVVTGGVDVAAEGVRKLRATLNAAAFGAAGWWGASERDPSADPPFDPSAIPPAEVTRPFDVGYALGGLVVPVIRVVLIGISLGSAAQGTLQDALGYGEEGQTGADAEAANAHVDSFELVHEHPEELSPEVAPTGAQGEEGPSERTANAAQYSLWAGLAAFILSVSGIPAAEVFDRQFVEALAGGRGIDSFTFFQAMGRGMHSYLTTAPSPTPNKVWFTIAELAETLESLSVLLPMGAADLKNATEEQSFRKRALVYRWLTERDTGVFGGDDDENPPAADSRGFFSGNPMDTRDLFTDPLLLMRTILKVKVTDRTTCNEPVPDYFEFECHRGDADLLGRVASGTIEDVERLQKAIDKFEETLNATIASAGDPAFEQMFSWIDWAIWLPIETVVKQLYRRFRPTNDDEIVELLANQRIRMLMWVKANVDAKLRKRFTDRGSCGRVFLDKLYNAREMEFEGGNANGDGSTPTTCIRRLGHRALSPSYLFPATRATELDYTDTQAAGVVVREYSAYHDAAKVYSETTRRGRDALARELVGVRGWEAAQSYRLTLVMASDSNTPLPNDARYAYNVPTEAYSLALIVPADVRLDAIVTTLTEQVERRIRLLCHGTQSHWRPSPLAALNVPETERHAVAVTLYAELWADELVTQHRIVDVTKANVVAALEPASVRAARRLAACARFVLETTAQYDHGFFELDDPALVATLAGRDAARLRRRLAMAHPSADFFVRETMQYLRDVAKAMVEVARLWGLSAPKRLPSEPLASLFSASPDGDDAFDRVHGCLELLPNARVSLDVKNRVLEAACGAYPAVLLQPRRPPKEDPVPRTLVMPAPDPQQFVHDLCKRMAVLRIPIDATVTGAEPVDPPPPLDVTALTKKLGALDVGSDQALFYVPFGYGDPSPRLVFPPAPSVMLGSVPVWSDAVAAAIAQIVLALDGVPAAAATWAAVVKPTYRCSNDADNVPHPATILVNRDGSAVPRLVARFRASECPDVPASVLQARVARPVLHQNAHDAAEHHVQDETCLHLQASVACLAWNAERILQSLLALVASSDDNTRGHFELEFEDNPTSQGNARARGYLCLACAIGAGMAAQSLGDLTPTCSRVAMAGQPQLDANEVRQMKVVLGRLQIALNTNNKAASALRLSEVCAIAYGVLIS